MRTRVLFIFKKYLPFATINTHINVLTFTFTISKANTTIR